MREGESKETETEWGGRLRAEMGDGGKSVKGRGGVRHEERRKWWR